MGLYAVDCPACQKPHVWFSGTMDQRCEACKKPKEWMLVYSSDYKGYVTTGSSTDAGNIEVIEKSAYNFQCKQIEDMAKTFNNSVQFYQEMIRGLESQVEVEKAEIARLLAKLKREKRRS